MIKYLITGVSSGIGRNLTKQLIRRGGTVWGIARREDRLKDLKKELSNSPKFFYSCADQSKDSDWAFIIKQLRREKFIPQVIIFNAAISEYDLEKQIKLESLEKMLNVNFLGVMKGINHLLPIVKDGTQFIAISSFSALKGSGTEGIGYASSKAALSIAFESLYQKYKNSKLLFKTIFFGPVNSGMTPFKKRVPFVTSEDQAVRFIIQSVKSKQGQYYYPKKIFLTLKLIKLLPPNIYFKILSMMESLHLKFQKNVN